MFDSAVSIGILGQWYFFTPPVFNMLILAPIPALQGAFAEHQTAIYKLNPIRTIKVVQVRTPDDLLQCDALIIPGGGEIYFLSLSDYNIHPWASIESTTIALLARLAGLLDPLRQFINAKPVWGTCAGAILLAQAVENTKKGGQELLGGINVTVARNGWGSQVGLISLRRL